MTETKFMLNIDLRLSPKGAQTVALHERLHLQASGAGPNDPGWDQIEKFERDHDIPPQLPARPEAMKRGFDRGRIQVYENPESSEVAVELRNLEEVLRRKPAPGAQAIRNGRILMREQGGRWVGDQAVLLHREGRYVTMEPLLDSGSRIEYESDGVYDVISPAEAREWETRFRTCPECWERLEWKEETNGAAGGHRDAQALQEATEGPREGDGERDP